MGVRKTIEYIIVLGYIIIPIISLVYFANEKKIPPDHEDFMRIYNLTDKITPELRKIYDNYNRSILTYILSLIFHLFALAWSSDVLLLVCWSESKKGSCGLFCCINCKLILCCMKFVFTQPLTIQFILYIVCFSTTAAQIILLSKSKITVNLLEEIDEQYNQAIELQYNDAVKMINMISSMLFITLIDLIAYCCYFKNKPIEGIEDKNAVIFMAVTEEVQIGNFYARKEVIIMTNLQ